MKTKLINDLIADHVGVNSRADCPLCGRAGSVRIKTEEGRVSVKCFGADCGLFGQRLEEITPDTSSSMPVHKQVPWNEFINDVFLVKQPANVTLYSHPKLNRTVYSDGTTVVGRGTHPKWYRYDSTKQPFYSRASLSRRNNTIVITEDAVSACAVTTDQSDGLAILGTSTELTTLLEYLKPYDNILIWLDEDAVYKANLLSLDIMQLTIGKYIKCIYSEKEPKELSTAEVRTIINNYLME